MPSYRAILHALLIWSYILTTCPQPCCAETTYVIEETRPDNMMWYWIFTASAVAAVGAGAYAAGHRHYKKGPKGPQGDIGIMGERGPQGDRGPEGPSGSRGISGSQGYQGPTGHIGPQGDSFQFPLGNDELSFYFTNGAVGDKSREVMRGIVTTPSQQQFATEKLAQGTGAFTKISPLPVAPIGTYHLTLIPAKGGFNRNSEVLVYKNGSILTAISFPTGQYDACSQLTVEFVYQQG